MNGWDIKEFFDEVIFEFYNLFNYLKSMKYKKYISKINYKSEFKKEANLILNGPSSKEIELNTETTNFFVNYGYRHPQFINIENPILVIIDTKMLKGEWHFDMIEEAKNINPSVEFVFNYKYLKSTKFRSLVKNVNCIGYINNSKIPTRFNWKKKLQIGGFNFGVGVAEQSLSLIATLKFKKINIYGFDGNNVILALMSKDTHFYGADDSKKWSDSRFTSRELRFLSYFIDRNFWLSKCLKHNNIKIINHTQSIVTSMYNDG